MAVCIYIYIYSHRPNTHRVEEARWQTTPHLASSPALTERCSPGHLSVEKTSCGLCLVALGSAAAAAAADTIDAVAAERAAGRVAGAAAAAALTDAVDRDRKVDSELAIFDSGLEVQEVVVSGVQAADRVVRKVVSHVPDARLSESSATAYRTGHGDRELFTAGKSHGTLQLHCAA